MALLIELTSQAHWSRRVLGHLGWLRGAVGAALGIAVAGGVTLLLVGIDAGAGALPFLVAPIGASAVLVFCVPASPLAQPWPVIGGDLVSAAIGLAAGHLCGDPWLAASVGVGIAIAAMSAARCLHPPGGACALLCALGASGPDPWGIAHLLPIAANVAVLCGIGWLYNTATGHPWPHRAPQVPPAPRPLYSRDDLAATLDEWNEVLDVDVDDLDALIQALLRRGRGGS